MIMSVGAVGSNSSPAVQPARQPATTAPAQAAGRDNDGDTDKDAQTVQPSTPSVNLNGQKVGQIVNVTA
jgi:hypothetical protein